jgi:excisionase family DNA binding protein
LTRDQDEYYLTVAEVAEVLRLNQQTVRNWIDQGSLPALRVGRRVRIKRSDLDRLLSDGYSAGANAAAPDDGPSAEDFWGGEPVGTAETPSGVDPGAASPADVGDPDGAGPADVGDPDGAALADIADPDGADLADVHPFGSTVAEPGATRANSAADVVEAGAHAASADRAL